MTIKRNSLRARPFRQCISLVLCSFLGAAHAQQNSIDSKAASFTFRDGQVHNRKVQVADGLLFSETDMIMGHADTNSGNRQTRGLSNTTYGRLWPNGVVPYRMSNNLPGSIRERVNTAVAHWNSIGAVTLVEVTDSNAIAYPDYINFVFENRCASWIGYQGTGAQSIYTGNNCSTGTIIHEIGHALGLLHEHTRPDRDQFVVIHWDRIQKDMEVNFEKMDGSVLLGDYDYGSIMHYGEYFFSERGTPTIEPIMATNAQIGQRIETSAGDKASVLQLYQSDLSLATSASSQVAIGETIGLTLQATNHTSVGSNSLSATVPVNNSTRLLSFNSNGWSCSQARTGAQIECQTPVLAAGASSSVTLNLSPGNTTGQMLLDAELSSRTHDTNLSNNRDSASVSIIGSVPTVAAAMDGGGSFDPRTLALALLLLSYTAAQRARRLERTPYSNH